MGTIGKAWENSWGKHLGKHLGKPWETHHAIHELGGGKSLDSDPAMLDGYVLIMVMFSILNMAFGWFLVTNS